VLFATSAAAAAADDVAAPLLHHDIRVILSGLPTHSDAHTENKSTGITTDDSSTLDSAGEISIGYQFTRQSAGAPIGIILGAHLDLIGISDKSGGVTDETAGIGPSLEAGFEVEPAHWLNLEAALVGGFGAAAEKVKGLGSKDLESASGSYGKVGVLVRAVFTIQPGFQLLAQFGYVALRMNTEFDDDPALTIGQYENRNDLKGATFGLGAGWRF
jgi:hypothetical protein